MTPTSQSMKQRPNTFRERCAQAEETYQKLYAKFQTHTFIDWGILTQVQEDDCITAVPPYSHRFDEFLGYWLSGGTPQNVPATLELYFPEPDEIDCAYLEDILSELDKISSWGTEVYITSKGSKLGIGPGVCWCYAENIARAQKWVGAAKDRLLKQQEALIEKPKARLPSAYSAQTPASLEQLLKNGFSANDFDHLLSLLGIINAGKHTEDSRPRTWSGAIAAVEEKKFLDTNNSKNLHAALIQRYGDGDGTHLPSLRSIQRGYNAGIPQSKEFYERARYLLMAR